MKFEPERRSYLIAKSFGGKNFFSVLNLVIIKSGHVSAYHKPS